MSTPAAKTLPRDAFIDTVFEHARSDRRVVFMSADLGAKALDRFRSELPRQFFHAGICEQNLMDVAAGLAQNGYNVFAYAMAPFVTLRCFEQIKVAIASMHLPLCIIGNGVGYSYDDAGPTHYATEDLGCMRSLGGCEIITPSDTRSVLQTARRALESPGFRYVRLDRSFLPDVYAPEETRFDEEGLVSVADGTEVAIVANGYMLQRALEAREALAAEGISAAVWDLYRIKPLPVAALRGLCDRFAAVVSVEEHFLSAGQGGALAEGMLDAGCTSRLLRIGIEDAYLFANGGRKHILSAAGIDPASIARRTRAFLGR